MNSIKNISIKISENITKNKEELNKINKYKFLKKQSENNNADDKLIEDLKSIGCLVNIASNKLIEMKFMVCKTCSSKVNANVIVCIPCALFCHSKHDLVEENSEFMKASCS